MSMPRGPHRTPAQDHPTASPVVEHDLEVDPGDLAEQQTDAVPPTADDPEQAIPLRAPALDRASEFDAADSLVEVRLDDEDDDWEG